MSNDVDYSQRDPQPGVAAQFVQRWSPRAFTKSQIDRATLARILDAARFAPSCYNEQPWRFYTSTKETFNDYLDLLVEGNQVWAKDSAVIGFLVAKRYFTMNGKSNAHARFDCGAAWMSLALQASVEGLYSHGMGGIKYDEIANYLKLDPEQDDLVMGFAIGKIGAKDSLPENLQKMEQPSGRKALSDIWLT